MKSMSSPILGMMAALMLVGIMGEVTSQWLVYASDDSGETQPFFLFTRALRQLILDAIQEVQSAPPDPDKQEDLGQFRQLTGQFQIDVMNTVLYKPTRTQENSCFA